MAYRYYRYSLDGNLSPQAAARALGETGGVMVRIDNREDRTGAGIEVREEDFLNAAGWLSAGATGAVAGDEPVASP